MNLATSLWLGLGGFLGANARYWLSVWITAHWGTAFPYGTLLINISGSFLLCFLVVFLSRHALLPPPLSVALTSGFLGAYTTFSTFSAEWLALLQNGQILRSLLYIGGSIVGGGLAGGCGVWLGRVL